MKAATIDPIVTLLQTNLTNFQSYAMFSEGPRPLNLPKFEQEVKVTMFKKLITANTVLHAIK